MCQNCTVRSVENNKSKKLEDKSTRVGTVLKLEKKLCTGKRHSLEKNTKKGFGIRNKTARGKDVGQAKVSFIYLFTFWCNFIQNPVKSFVVLRENKLGPSLREFFSP
jgi:hypothetical protein